MSTTQPRGLSGRVVYPLLLVILLSGFALRVWNLNFDRGIGSHPDERSTACFYATTIKLPASWEEFRDPQRSPMNPLWDVQQQRPRSFTYGHLPLYLGVVMGELFHRLAPVAAVIGAPAETVNRKLLQPDQRLRSNALARAIDRFARVDRIGCPRTDTVVRLGLE